MSHPDRKTSVTDLLESLDAGIFEQKLAVALSDVAMGVVTTGKKGKVIVTFDLEQIASSNQVNLNHTLKFAKPTAHGKVIEDNTTATPMHVGVGGKLSLFPDTQAELPIGADRTRTVEAN